MAAYGLTAAKTPLHDCWRGVAGLRHTSPRVALLFVPAKQPQIFGNDECGMMNDELTDQPPSFFIKHSAFIIYSRLPATSTVTDEFKLRER
jgi:hypothetical protein